MQKDIFQRIIDREIPSTIIYEDDKTIAFLDINPHTKGHFLVVSKEFSDDDLTNLILTARKLALSQIEKLNAKGFRLEINSGIAAGQEIFRTHVHIIPYYDD